MSFIIQYFMISGHWAIPPHKSCNFRWQKPSVKISVKQKSMNLRVSPIDISRNPGIHIPRCYVLIVIVSFIIQYFMISGHWAVLLHHLSFCTQSTFHADWFWRRFLEQWPFVLIRQMCPWKDTKKQLKVLLSLLCAAEGAYQTLSRIPFAFTDRESLTQ